jgi:RHS repeat-associated protein
MRSLQYTYEPFGNTTVSGASSTKLFQYTGRENDGTGLYYYRARYYHPILQRFISEDPIGFVGGDVNLYGYVLNDPMDFRDPWGLIRIPWGRGLGGVSEFLGNAFDNSGTWGYYGGAAGGALGAVAGGAIGGAPGAVVGGVGGGLLGGALGGLFDDPCAGQLNCGEPIPLPAEPLQCH